MKHTISPLLALFISLLFLPGACKKPESATPVKAPGTFTATVDGVDWEPKQYSATYTPGLQLLTIVAQHPNEVLVGVQIDTLSPLKVYTLEPLGSRAAAAYSINGLPYNSDQNVPDAGGSFELLKFDTVAKKASVSFSFTGYSSERVRLRFVSKVVSDITLTQDSTPFKKNDASCTVVGVTTSNWKTADVTGSVNCTVNSVPNALRIEMPSVLGGYPNRRHLLFSVPLNLKPGTYPIRPDVIPYFYCGSGEVTCRYAINDYNKPYQATSGSFTVISLDTAARKLTANFQVAVRDNSVRQETIQINNGQLKLSHW